MKIFAWAKVVAMDTFHPHFSYIIRISVRKLASTSHSYPQVRKTLPERYCKSTRFVGKIMFLAAVARPRWDYERNEWFDGKIGTWHFTEEVPALRTSRNRKAGTMETKPVNVDRGVYKAMLLEKVIPAIKSKWPAHETKRVKIQQDNARPHISPSDHDIVRACTEGSWKIDLVCQPPNSPDLNVLDLGFFRAVQTVQQRENCANIKDVITATEKAWAHVPMSNLTRNFLTLQSVMMEILRVDGGNHFKIPHMKKSTLMVQGRLPDSIDCDVDLWNHASLLLGEEDFEAREEEMQLQLLQALACDDLVDQMAGVSMDAKEDESDALAIFCEPDILADMGAEYV